MGWPDQSERLDLGINLIGVNCLASIVVNAQECTDRPACSVNLDIIFPDDRAPTLRFGLHECSIVLW